MSFSWVIPKGNVLLSPYTYIHWYSTYILFTCFPFNTSNLQYMQINILLLQCHWIFIDIICRKILSTSNCDVIWIINFHNGSSIFIHHKWICIKYKLSVVTLFLIIDINFGASNLCSTLFNLTYISSHKILLIKIGRINIKPVINKRTLQISLNFLCFIAILIVVHV